MILTVLCCNAFDKYSTPLSPSSLCAKLNVVNVYIK